MFHYDEALRDPEDKNVVVPGDNGEMTVKELIQILKQFDPYDEITFVGQEGRDIPLDGIEELKAFGEVQFAFDVED